MSPNKNAMKNPSYRQVCTGMTGHVEVLNVELNEPTPELFEELIRFFFMFHDPTTLNRQGNDVGTQYGSVIFTNGELQAEIAKKVLDELQGYIDTKKVKYSGRKVVTLISSANEFYEAHAEHQDYLSKNPSGYCNHYFRFKDWPDTCSEMWSLILSVNMCGKDQWQTITNTYILV